MKTCFVIQPFDGGKFDRRYKDIFAPAIKDANLEPYRVDEDFSVQIPIQDIEKGIRNSAICLVDITLDNPNVWYELGYAFSSHKPVVLICSDERTSKFPFDIQHRSIIRYSSASLSDYNQLKSNITSKLNAYLVSPEKPKNPYFKVFKALKRYNFNSEKTLKECKICKNL